MDDWADWKDVLNGTDIETAQLIVQLQLEDAEAVTPNARHLNPRSDANLARRLCENELRQLQSDFPGGKLGEDLEDDENDLQEALEAAAFGWKLKQWEGHVEHVPEPVPEPAPQPVRPIACTACADDYHPHNIARVPCGHRYCRGCLEELYTSCMTDETLLPPRCCHQEFPWAVVSRYLSQQCRSKFGQKRVELETKDRTYCYRPTCSAFIKLDAIVDSVGSCRNATVLHAQCASLDFTSVRVLEMKH